MKKKIPLAAPPERPELSNTPIKLCNEISRLCRAHLSRDRETDSVFVRQGARLTVSYLALRDGVTQLDLVRATHLRAPTVSVMLRGFEEEGIVERRPDEQDGRAMRVYLTDKGRELDRCNIQRIRRMDDAVLQVLSEEEQNELMRLLGRIRDRFLELGEEGTEETL